LLASRCQRPVDDDAVIPIDKAQAYAYYPHRRYGLGLFVDGIIVGSTTRFFVHDLAASKKWGRFFCGRRSS